MYFVTICSKDRKNIFTEIKPNAGAGLASARFKLTELGQIININWQNIENQYDNIGLDRFIIMPNHIHGILIINEYGNRADTRPAPTLSDIVCSFKSKCSVEYLKYIKQNDLNISYQIWQRSFHDHVIRNEKSLREIREYIVNNPLNWDIDKNNINGNS